jgi:hypothetical protein
MANKVTFGLPKRLESPKGTTDRSIRCPETKEQSGSSCISHALGNSIGTQMAGSGLAKHVLDGFSSLADALRILD